MIIEGDSIEKLRELKPESVDAVVTDPPYGLGNTSPARVAQCLRAWLGGDIYESGGVGFMGKSWDSWVPDPQIWEEVFRVLKPGAHGFVFAGTRTQDLMTLSLRLAGFEIRDTLMWFYGSGFPKSHNVALGIKKKFKGVNENYELSKNWKGWGTALKPAYEPIILVRKPLEGTVAENILKYSCGAINIDGTRICTLDNLNGGAYAKTSQGRHDGKKNWRYNAGGAGDYEQPSGRWPANVILSHSEECTEETCEANCVNTLIDKQSGHQKSGRAGKNSRAWGVAGKGQLSSKDEGVGWKAYGSEGYSDEGGASRFFYTSKASKKEKNAGCEKNPHPTVKPMDLMRYLCKMICPPQAKVLDPFAGSGTTIIAAMLEGFEGVGIEREPEYVEIAKQRLKHWRDVARAEEEIAGDRTFARAKRDVARAEEDKKPRLKSADKWDQLSLFGDNDDQD